MRIDEYDHIEMRHNVPWVRISIPKAARPILGKSEFKTGMNGMTREEARHHSRPLIEAWRQEIERARAQSRDERQAIIARFHREYAAARQNGNSFGTFFDIIDWVLQRDGGMTAMQQRAALQANRNLAAVARQAPRGEQAAAALSQITGIEAPPATHTMMSKYLEDYEELHNGVSVTCLGFRNDNRLSTSRVLRIVRFVRQFDREVGLSLEQLQTTAGPEAVQRWLKKKADAGQWVESSITSNLGCFQGFWRWLHVRAKVANKRGPFHDRELPLGRDGDIIIKGRRRKGPAFRREDIARMCEFAEHKWVPDSRHQRVVTPYALSAFIHIAAWFGFRRSGIMGLKPEHVKIDPESQRRYIHVKEKIRGDSKAGDRRVPVPPMLDDLIDELCKNADPYLIPIDGNASISSRGGYMTQAFVSLIEQMGIRTDDGAEAVHSLRKNFSHALKLAAKQAGADSDLRKQIFGHKIKGLIDDPDVYGYKYTIEECYDVMRRIEYPGFTLPETDRATRH